MFSFLFNTFINLYLGLVVSYIRDLNPQYNSVLQHHDEGLCLQTASGSNQPKVLYTNHGACRRHKPSGINNSEISCQCFL